MRFALGVVLIVVYKLREREHREVAVGYLRRVVEDERVVVQVVLQADAFGALVVNALGVSACRSADECSGVRTSRRIAPSVSMRVVDVGYAFGEERDQIEERTKRGSCVSTILRLSCDRSPVA